jgi:hypothetical protein
MRPGSGSAERVSLAEWQQTKNNPSARHVAPVRCCGLYQNFCAFIGIYFDSRESCFGKRTFRRVLFSLYFMHLFFTYTTLQVNTHTRTNVLSALLLVLNVKMVASLFDCVCSFGFVCWASSSSSLTLYMTRL